MSEDVAPYWARIPRYRGRNRILQALSDPKDEEATWLRDLLYFIPEEDLKAPTTPAKDAVKRFPPNDPRRLPP